MLLLHVLLKNLVFIRKLKHRFCPTRLLRDLSIKVVPRKVPVFEVRNDTVHEGQLVLQANVAELLDVLWQVGQQLLLVAVSALDLDHE